MISNFLKTFKVFASKNAFLYSVKNLTLVIGIAVSILVFQVILYESGYERSYKNWNNIYRVVLDYYNNETKEISSCQTYFPVGQEVVDKFPEVEESSRIIKFVGDWIIAYKDSLTGNKVFYENKACIADKSFLNQFSIELTQGDTSELDLKVLLSEDAAKKYFGEEDPIGKTMILTTFMGTWYHEVSGVYKNMPANSHFQFDFMFFMMQPFTGTFKNNWGNNFVYTYLTINPKTNIRALENKLTQYHNESRGKTDNSRVDVHLQPISSIHLNSDLDGEFNKNGDQKIVTLYWIVGIIVLLLSCLIYINLSTSLIIKRTKEIIIKKVLGSEKSLLNFQFIFENFITILLSFTIGLLLARLLQNYVISNLNLNLETSVWGNSYFWIFLLVIMVLLVLISGFIPGIIVSGLSIMGANSKSHNSGKVLFLKKTFVFLQYILSIGLIAGIITIFFQLHFMQNVDTGFNKDNVIVLKTILSRNSENAEFYSLKEELKRMPLINSVSNSNEIPGSEASSTSSVKRMEDNSSDYKQMYKIDVDYQYLDALGIKLIAGRFYSNKFGNEEENIVLNITAVKQLGYKLPEEAINTYITEKSKKTRNLKIIGVINDFRQQYAKHAISPIIIRIVEKTTGYMTLRLNNNVNMNDAIVSIEKLWKNYYPEVPFQYYVLSDHYNEQYKGDMQFARLMTILVIIIIIMSCIGFLGLSSFQTLQKTKEIGIRRALGASAASVICLFLKEQLILIVIASVISLGLTFFIFSKWLMGFADRISIGAWFVFLPVVTILLISFLTTSFHVVKASLSDPTKALRYE